MDFDHKNPLNKTFNISEKMGRSLNHLLDEIAKCDIVCSNCHRVRTWDKKYKNRKNNMSTKKRIT